MQVLAFVYFFLLPLSALCAVISPNSLAHVPTRARRQELDTRPTPQPTGPDQKSTTVHVIDESDFSILLPKDPSNESISDAEVDAVAFCSSGSSRSPDDCPKLPDDFILAAAVVETDDYIQITACIDPTVVGLDQGDGGGQYDVRYPNGAQCTFGGYGNSFIQQTEPDANRFCMRCCKSEDDQTNCNSHQDKLGCISTIPGTYDFPDQGVFCS